MRRIFYSAAAVGLAFGLGAGLGGAPALAQKMVTQGVTDTEILLGTHLDLSGPVAAGMGPIKNGLDMKIKEINAAGGIHGRKIRLIIEDSGYQPAKAVRAVQKLVKKDKVFAILSAFGTGPTIASHGVAIKAGIPHLFPWSGVAGPFHGHKSPLSFTNVVNYDWGTAAGVAWIVKELKAKKVCVLYQDDAFGKLVQKGTAEALAKSNMKIAARAGFKPGSVDLSSQLASLKNAGCDLVVLATIVRETLSAVAGAKKIGWNVPMITSIPGRNEIITKIAAKVKMNLDGLYGIGQWKIHTKDTKDPKVKAWIEKYEATYKAPTDNGAMVAYSLMEWTAQGLQKAGRDLTAEKFVEAMRTTPYTDIFGNPTVSLASGNHASPQAVGVDQLKNNVWVRISPLLTDVK